MHQLAILLHLLLLLACLVYLLPLRKTPGFWRRCLLVFPIAGLGGSIFFGAAAPLFTIEWINTLYWLARPFVSFAAVCAVFKLCSRLAARETVYGSVWVYLTYEFSYDFNQIVESFMQTRSEGSTISYFGAMVFCYGFVFLAAYLLVARSLPEDGHFVLQQGQLRSALLLTLLTTVFKPLGAVLTNGSFSYNIFVLSQVIFAFAIMCILYSQCAMGRKQMLEEELALQKRLWHQHKEHLEVSRQNVELLNCKYHDLKHYIVAARSKTDEAIQMEMLAQIEKSVKVFDSAVHTGNDILDTVLTEKSLLCERRSITMSCVVDGKLLGGMEAVDIYTIFANAVDNAVECVSTLSDSDQRVISIAVFRVRNLVKIQIENYYEQPLTFQGDLPITTKADTEYHGYGLRSIRHTVEKYNGYMSLEAKDKLFLLHILLPTDRVSDDQSAD